MVLNEQTMNQIHTAIAEHVHRQNQGYGQPLAYSFRTSEIDLAEDELRRTNSLICLVKVNSISGIKMYYYRHPLGNFTVSLDFNDQLRTLDCN